VELLGLGREALRYVPVDGEYRIDLRALEQAIDRDRREGLLPFALVGNAGTVNTGALDDLPALASIARREGLHFHVDGAIGALAVLSPELRDRFRGVADADSLAFDPHKWGHFPIEAGCILVRDGAAHRAAFASSAAYLARAQGGVAARTELFSDLGPQLSRGFKALKVWMGLKAFGADKLGRLMRQNVAQAAFLADRVRDNPELQLMAPAPLNIVCFRYRGPAAPGAPEAEADLDALNRALLVDLQESGLAVPSSTLLGGRFAIRVCITNHRTRLEDLVLLVHEAARRGRALAESRATVSA
jgi:glutamate/tyrosine decarboxylase-like PLP-dependent enzyme